eukprot:scaffold1130_cov195-Pinguiococcus_pyrenoidosus.AAC.27
MRRSEIQNLNGSRWFPQSVQVRFPSLPYRRAYFGVRQKQKSWQRSITRKYPQKNWKALVSYTDILRPLYAAPKEAKDLSA